MQTPQLFISVIPVLFGICSFIWHMQQVLRNDYNVLYEQTMYMSLISSTTTLLVYIELNH